MSARAASGEATTYLLEASQLAEVVDFVAELARRGVAVPEPRPALVGADGSRLEVPGPVFEALVQVARRWPTAKVSPSFPRMRCLPHRRLPNCSASRGPHWYGCSQMARSLMSSVEGTGASCSPTF